MLQMNCLGMIKKVLIFNVQPKRRLNFYYFHNESLEKDPIRKDERIILEYEGD